MRKKRVESVVELPRLMRQHDVIKQVQSEGILKRLVAGGWLCPVVKERKYTVYRRADVDAVVERLLTGEMPPPLPSRTVAFPSKTIAQ